MGRLAGSIHSATVTEIGPEKAEELRKAAMVTKAANVATIVTRNRTCVERILVKSRVNNVTSSAILISDEVDEAGVASGNVKSVSCANVHRRSKMAALSRLQMSALWKKTLVFVKMLPNELGGGGGGGRVFGRPHGMRSF